MATVFLAEDRRQNDRLVAIKVLDPDLPASNHADRFLREVGIVSMLAHPHIVPVHDSGVADGALFFVMPYIEGETLRQHLKRSGPLDPREAAEIAEDIGRALEYAHERGIVHRDVKPENVLLSSGEALVTDFGIAALSESSDGTHLTSPGTRIGTCTYMSPEQITGSFPLDGRADIYALGCLTYEMVTGEPPFKGAEATVLAGHLYGAIPSARAVRPEVPPEMSSAIERALAKDPEERPGTAKEFLDELRGDRGRTWFQRRKRRRVAAGAAFGLVLVTAVAVALWMRTAERLDSLLVVPFSTAATTETEESLSTELAEEVIGALSGWETVEVVPRVALAGPMFDLGLGGSSIVDIEDARRLARAFQAPAFLAVTVDCAGDTLTVAANLFNSTGGRMPRRTLRARGTVLDLRTLADTVAGSLLELEGLGVSLDLLRRHSSNPTALQEDDEGRKALEQWRLADAETHFRHAVELDSTFALAQLRLAQTLYWEAADSDYRLRSAAPEIARHSAAADAHSRGLPAADSLRVRAFVAFQAGDYETARDLYRHLLDDRSSDVYALLMLGSTEFRDRWLTPTVDGELLPRSNLNVALRAFGEAIRLQPTSAVAYGHLFDIHRWIAESAYQRSCPGFEEPRGELIPPGQSGDPEFLRAFCPVVHDSVVWIAKNTLDQMDREEYAASASALFDVSMGLLSRWAAYDPSQPRPLEETSRILLERRQALGIADPEEHRRLATRAVDAFSRSMALSSDSSPEDLFRLASMYLAADRPDSARAALDRGMGRSSGSPQASAASVLFAIGHGARALDVVSVPWRHWYLEDEGGGGLIDYGGGEVAIDRGLIHGITGNPEGLSREMARLDTLWNRPRYTPEQITQLWNDAAKRLVAPLAWNEEILESLQARVTVETPLWMAVTGRSPPGPAAEYLTELGSWSAEGRASSAMALARTAWRGGSPEMALQLFSRLDSIPFPVTAGFEGGWGLRVRSWYERGSLLEEMGEPERAASFYRRFIAWWQEEDGAAGPLVRHAREHVARFR